MLQDILRVLIIRMSCTKLDYASKLLRPVLDWIKDHSSQELLISSTDVIKGEQLLRLLTGLLEHPSTKMLLMEEKITIILIDALDKINKSLNLGELQDHPNGIMEWYSLIFRSFTLICDPEISMEPTGTLTRRLADCPSYKECYVIASRLLDFCGIAPVKKELQACLVAIRALAGHNLGRDALYKAASMSWKNERSHVFPLFACCQNLARKLTFEKDYSTDTAEIINCFGLGALSLCAAGKSASGMMTVRLLFGISDHSPASAENNEVKLKPLHEVIDELTKITKGTGNYFSNGKAPFEKAGKSFKAMLCLLNKPTDPVELPKGRLQPESLQDKTLPVSMQSFPPPPLAPHLSFSPFYKISINEDTFKHHTIEWPLERDSPRTTGTTAVNAVSQEGGHTAQKNQLLSPSIYSNDMMGNSGGVTLSSVGITVANPVSDASEVASNPGGSNFPQGSMGGIKQLTEEQKYGQTESYIGQYFPPPNQAGLNVNLCTHSSLSSQRISCNFDAPVPTGTIQYSEFVHLNSNPQPSTPTPLVGWPGNMNQSHLTPHRTTLTHTPMPSHSTGQGQGQEPEAQFSCQTDIHPDNNPQRQQYRAQTLGQHFEQGQKLQPLGYPSPHCMAAELQPGYSHQANQHQYHHPQQQVDQPQQVQVQQPTPTSATDDSGTAPRSILFSLQSQLDQK